MKLRKLTREEKGSIALTIAIFVLATLVAIAIFVLATLVAIASSSCTKMGQPELDGRPTKRPVNIVRNQ